jgi:hypothetical protein
MVFGGFGGYFYFNVMGMTGIARMVEIAGLGKSRFFINLSVNRYLNRL